MAFRRIENKVYIEGTIEAEVLALCEKIPNLGVVCVHTERASSAALRFYMGLDQATRKRYPMQKTRHRTDFPNGSFIVFVSTFSMSESFVTRLPEEEYHVVVAYGVSKPYAIVGVLSRIKHPGARVGEPFTHLFPMYVNGSQIYLHREVETHYAALYKSNDVIVDTEQVDMFANYYHPTHKWKNVDEYPAAKEVLEEEQELEQGAKEYEEYIARKEKRQRLAERYENKRPYEELARLRGELEDESGIIDEDNE